MRILTLGIFTICISAICQGVPLFPKGHRWEYDYTAKAFSGVVAPVKATTGLRYQGKLIIESFSNKVVLMQLLNLESLYYNGEKIMKGKGEPLPEEAKIIEKPFLVHYSESKIDSIFVTPDEPIWAVNMKKAVAGVFQLDMDKLEEGAMYTEESNIYGPCKNIEYNVQKSKPDTLEITKMISFEKCARTYKIFTTTENFICKPDKPTVGSAKRMYTLKMGEYPVLKNITTLSERLANGFSAVDGAYKLLSKQKIGLLKESKLPENHVVPDSCTVKKSIVYEHTSNYDMTHGRHPMTQEQILEIIDELLAKVVHRFEGELTLSPKLLHQNSMQYLHWLMHSLTVESFEKLYAKVSTEESCLQDSKWNILLDLMPQIGTYNSVMFLKKMLVTGKIGSNHSFKIIAQYPFYVKELSEKLLVEMEELLHVNPEKYHPKFYTDFSNHVILSFANLVYKTYSNGFCSREVFEKYVGKYYKYYTENEGNYKKQVVYIQALRNFQHGSVYEKLMPIIKNKSLSYHLRVQAVGAISDNVRGHPSEMYQLFWPIFTDRKEHLELRALAMDMLLFAEPTHARFFAVYWYMKSEPCKKLYNLYYTTLSALQQSTYPCYEDLATLADKFIKYVKLVPESASTKFTKTFLQDFVNYATGIGSLFQYTIIGDGSGSWPSFGYYTSSKNVYGRLLEKLSLYIKVGGLADFLDMNRKPDIDTNKFTYEDLVKLIENDIVKIRSPEPILVEFFIEAQNKIVLTKTVDIMTAREQSLALVNEFSTISPKCEHVLNMQFSYPPTMMNLFGTTDFGTFAYVGFMRNSISSVRSNFSQATITGNGGISMHFRNVDFLEQRIDLYNPINDFYQGINKMHVLESAIAANIDFKKKTSSDSVNRILWTDSHGNNGLVLHKQTVTYIANSQDLLHTKKSSVFSLKSIDQVDLAERDDKLMLEKARSKSFKWLNMGIRVNFALFDCDYYSDIPFDGILEFLEDLSDAYEGIESDDIRRMYYRIMSQLQEKLLFGSIETNCGVGVIIEPLNLEDTSVLEIEWSSGDVIGLRKPSEITELSTKDNELFVSGSLYPLKNPDKIYNWWNITAITVRDFGLLKQFNWQLTLKDLKQEKPVSFCLDFKLDYDGGKCEHPQAAFYNLEPIKDTTLKLNWAWGHPKAIEMCPESHSINYVCKASISKEQIDEEKAAERWPFKECNEHLRGRKYNSATEACYVAAVEMSTYRFYDSVITFKEAPKLLENVVNAMAKVMQLIPKVPHIQPQFKNGNSKIKFTELLPMDVDEDLIEFTYENTPQLVLWSFSGFEPFNPKVQRAKLDIHRELGVCVISSDVIRSYTNRTWTNYPMNEKLLLLAECVPRPAYVIFMKENEKIGTTFNVITPECTIDIIPTEGGELTVNVNGEVVDITKTIGNWPFEITKHSNGYHFKLHKLNVNLDMTIRKGFTVITSPQDNTCGVCNLRPYEYEDFTKKHKAV